VVLPRWLSDPAKGDGLPRGATPPADSMAGADFTGIFPSQTEARDETRAQLDRAAWTSRSLVAFGGAVIIGALLLIGALVFTDLPRAFIVCALLSLALCISLAVWAFKSPSSYSAFAGRLNGYPARGRGRRAP
jgi:hypothetical protein